MIDINKIKQLPDGSVVDAELIRQLSIHSIEENDISLLPKIKKGFEVCGLYPFEMKKLNIKPNKNG